MTDVERQTALEAIAAEVRVCTNCRLHETRTRAVPGEGAPDTEVVFVGEGPGFNEDRQGRPFVGRAGDLLVKLLASIGWRREDVFITNVVKCRPAGQPRPATRRDRRLRAIPAASARGARPGGHRHPGPVFDGDVHAGSADLAGARHGPPGRSGDGRASATVFAMYHPAAALRTPAIERESYADIANVPGTLIASRARRETTGTAAPAPEHAAAPEPSPSPSGRPRTRTPSSMPPSRRHRHPTTRPLN